MIFVTVGTHEQGFERIVKQMDLLVEKKVITEKVMIQTGFTKYKPKHCAYKPMLSNEEMIKYISKARIIITHGGPGSIMLPFQYGKIPIVVPRRHEFNEHVDNHQVKFVKHLERDKKVLAVYDIEKLGDMIVNYNKYIVGINANYEDRTKQFTENLERICLEP